MTADRGEMERLERRLAELETTVRDLVRLTGLKPGAIPERRPPTGQPASESRPAPRKPPPPVPQPGEWKLTNEQLEQWFGQRGLLVVGVVALVAAGGFFLKYAFDRGWIAPWLRCVGAVLIGGGVAFAGENQINRGLKRYGAGLIAAGAGLAYLGLWAAAGPYQLIGRQAGVLIIALATSALLWRAAHHRIETLGALAAAGALMGPVLLPVSGADPKAFLGYIQLVALSFGYVAHRLSWRITADILLAGYLLLPAVLLPDSLHTPAGLLFAAVGGVAALAVTKGRSWDETRLLGVLMAWVMLLYHANLVPREAADTMWVALGAGALLLFAAWDQHRRHPAFTQTELPVTNDAETVLFMAAPLAFSVMPFPTRPAALAALDGVVMAPVAALYLAAGWRIRGAALVTMGLALTGLTIAMQFDGPVVIMLWTLLAIAAQALDRTYHQPGARIAAAVAAAAAFANLFTVAVATRGSGPAFADSWALALYVLTLGLVWMARGWRPRENAPAWEKDAPVLLWGLMAAAVFIGGSIELVRFFGAQRFAGADLAQKLSLSVYWLLYAGAAVRVGFLVGSRPVRATGLLVAGLAALKIVTFDLQNLDALYRVGSFFVLALIALAVAYAYHRRAQRERAA